MLQPIVHPTKPNQTNLPTNKSDANARMMFVVLCPKTVTHRSDSSTEMNVTRTAVKTTKNRRLVAYAKKKQPCLLFFRLGFFQLSSRFSHKCKITTFLCCHHIILLFKRKKKTNGNKEHTDLIEITLTAHSCFIFIEFYFCTKQSSFVWHFFSLLFAVVLIIGQAALIRSF